MSGRYQNRVRWGRGREERISGVVQIRSRVTQREKSRRRSRPLSCFKILQAGRWWFLKEAEILFKGVRRRKKKKRVGLAKRTLEGWWKRAVFTKQRNIKGCTPDIRDPTGDRRRFVPMKRSGKRRFYTGSAVPISTVTTGSFLLSYRILYLPSATPPTSPSSSFE